MQNTGKVKNTTDMVANIQGILDGINDRIIELKKRLTSLEENKNNKQAKFIEKITNLVKQREYDIQKYHIRQTRLYCEDLELKIRLEQISLIDENRALKRRIEDLEVKNEYYRIKVKEFADKT